MRWHHALINMTHTVEDKNPVPSNVVRGFLVKKKKGPRKWFRQLEKMKQPLNELRVTVAPQYQNTKNAKCRRLIQQITLAEKTSTNLYTAQVAENKSQSAECKKDKKLPEKLHEHASLIDAMGGPSTVCGPLSKKSGKVVSRNALCMWRHRGVPYEYRVVFSGLAKELGAGDKIPDNFLKPKV